MRYVIKRDAMMAGDGRSKAAILHGPLVSFPQRHYRLMKTAEGLMKIAICLIPRPRWT
jgi:hypothetical protein